MMLEPNMNPGIICNRIGSLQAHALGITQVPYVIQYAMTMPVAMLNSSRAPLIPRGDIPIYRGATTSIVFNQWSRSGDSVAINR